MYECYNCGATETSSPLLSLVCEHCLCFACAQKLKTVEGTPPLDEKFRLICRVCGKTIHNKNGQLMFTNMQSSQLSEKQLQQPSRGLYEKRSGGISQSKLRKMSYSERIAKIYEDRKTPEEHERVSKASYQYKRQVSSRGRSSLGRENRGQNQNTIEKVQCDQHQQPLMFFCEQQSRVLCMQCMYKHMKQHKQHKISSIKDALPVIHTLNVYFKDQTKLKINQLQKCISICNNNKKKLIESLDIHQQLIDRQFQQLRDLLSKKQNQTREYIECHFGAKQKKVEGQLLDLIYLKQCMQKHHEYETVNAGAQVYFFKAYSMIRGTVGKLSTNFRQLKKQELACFDKLVSQEDFSILLGRFFKLKENQGRDSKPSGRTTALEKKAPSRGGNSDHGGVKAINYDEYKNIKKKLDKLNKVQNENKGKMTKKDTYFVDYPIQSNNRRVIEHQLHRQIGAATGGRNPSQNEGKKGKALTPTRIITGRGKKK